MRRFDLLLILLGTFACALACRPADPAMRHVWVKPRPADAPAPPGRGPVIGLYLPADFARLAPGVFERDGDRLVVHDLDSALALQLSAAFAAWGYRPLLVSDRGVQENVRPTVVVEVQDIKVTATFEATGSLFGVTDKASASVELRLIARERGRSAVVVETRGDGDCELRNSANRAECAATAVSDALSRAVLAAARSPEFARLRSAQTHDEKSEVTKAPAQAAREDGGDGPDVHAVAFSGTTWQLGLQVSGGFPWGEVESGVSRQSETDGEILFGFLLDARLPSGLYIGGRVDMGAPLMSDSHPVFPGENTSPIRFRPSAIVGYRAAGAVQTWFEIGAGYDWDLYQRIADERVVENYVRAGPVASLRAGLEWSFSDGAAGPFVYFDAGTFTQVDRGGNAHDPAGSAAAHFAAGLGVQMTGNFFDVHAAAPHDCYPSCDEYDEYDE